MLEFLYWPYTYVIEFAKMYLIISGIFGTDLKREKRTTYLFGIGFFVSLVAAQLPSSVAYYVLLIIILMISVVNFKTVIKTAVSYLMITMLDFIIGSGIIILLDMDYEASYYSQSFSVFVGIISFFTLFLIVLIRQFFTNQSKLQISKKDIGVIGILFFGMLAFSVPVMGKYLERSMMNGSIQIFLGILSILVAVLIVFIKYQKTENENMRYQLELEWSDEFSREQKRYYELLLQKEEETKKFRHDITNQLQCLREYLKEDKEKAEQYLKQITKGMDTIPRIVSTGNFVVDIAVNDTLPADGCNVLWKGTIPQKLHIKDLELFSLFSNLMRNAQEAVRKNEKIYCSIKEMEDTVVIEIENPIHKEVVIEENKPMSTKKDKTKHGYGSKIIEEITKANGGKIFYKQKDGKFNVRIIFFHLVENEKTTYPDFSTAHPKNPPI